MVTHARRLAVVVAMIAVALLFVRVGNVRADEPRPGTLSASGTGAVVQAPDSPQVPVPLIVDDGSAEDAIGLTAGGSFFWFNRFTPTAAQFPFRLQQVQVLFTADGGCAVGDAMDIYIYTDADGNPANGATHVGSITGQTVQALGSWSTYPTNLLIGGPGDVLIGVVNRGCNDAGQFPAAIDTTGSQGRSWVVFGGTSTDNPPTFPPPEPATIDSLGFPGNWMIRGLGDTDIDGPTPTPLPSSTPTATATPLPAGSYCSTAALPIPDGNPTGITQTINVPDSGTLTDLDVYIKVTHTWLGDVQLTVEHNGTTVNMFDRPGVPGSTFGCSGDNIDNTFDDAGTIPAESGCTNANPAYPVGARLIPNEPLAAFNGMDRSGTWTITARDYAGGDSGTLNLWCLNFQPVGEPTATATATATATLPPTVTATVPPTSIELGTLGSNSAAPTGGWLIGLVGLGLVGLGLIARRRL